MKVRVLSLAAVAAAAVATGVAADVDPSSAFTEAELNMTPADLMDAARSLDRNRDGYLDERETKFMAADDDKDGRVSMTEYVLNASPLRIYARTQKQLRASFNFGHPIAVKLEETFDGRDANKDGFLTRDELPNFEEGLAYDSNKDGRLAREEFVKELGYILIANEAQEKHRAALKATLTGVETAEAPRAPTRTPSPTPPAQVAVAPAPEPVRRPSPAAQAAGPRIALVIGNSAYDARLGPLANPARDAKAVAEALRKAGFDVEVATDLDQKGMKRAIARLGERLNASGRGATGLFFYAGHGLQSQGTNYLAPIGAAIEKEADIDLEAVAADTVLRQMDAVGNATNIVILDACRNTPILRSTRSASRGLARMDASTGSFVAYSTAPGAEAADGDGANSPFVTALIQEIAKPGEPIEVVFRNVRRAVRASTQDKQVPWDSSSLVESFVFTPT